MAARLKPQTRVKNVVFGEAMAADFSRQKPQARRPQKTKLRMAMEGLEPHTMLIVDNVDRNRIVALCTSVGKEFEGRKFSVLQTTTKHQYRVIRVS